MFTVASPVNLQDDAVYAPSNLELGHIVAERLLRCQPTFSSSLMVSVAVSKLGCTELFFVTEGGRQILPRGFAEEADAASHAWYRVSTNPAEQISVDFQETSRRHFKKLPVGFMLLQLD